MRNTGSLAFEQERELPIPPKRSTAAVPAVDPVARQAALLAAGYSGMEEHSTPFHAFLEHSTTFLFP
ncbi:MAG TPA: hypothetical protein VFH15_13465, partial [Pyrinomonadaceae bacterium]|nr:hypothetical protein [Pyrinomonadaceae bacterium]